MGQMKRAQVLLCAGVFGALGATQIPYLFNDQFVIQKILSGVTAVIFFIGFALCMDIWQLNPADSHTLSTLYSQYKYLLYLRWNSARLIRKLKEETDDPKKTSEEALFNILRTNQDTVYGKEYNFKDIKSREEFVKKHPLTTQEHYKKYIDRVTNGERNVVHVGEPYCLISTSGTTGASKIYPFCEGHVQAVKQTLGTICPLSVLNSINLQRNLQFHIYSPMRYSDGGIPIGAGTQVLFIFPPHNIVPLAYSRLHTEEASYYAQALFCLAEREMRYISGFSADLMYSFWKFIVSKWDNLCQDIAQGYIGDHISMPSDVKRELSGQLQADPKRAEELTNALKVGKIGLAKRIWPDMEFMLMGKSAGFKMCATSLMETFLKGLQIIDFGHGATEGLTGIRIPIDLSDTDDAFTLQLSSAFFLEFVPFEDVEKDQPATVFPEQLQVGHMYEVVHTNLNGLYRVRYGDIIKVVGFTGKTPKYEFLYRLGQRLNIAYERTPDKYLIQAVEHETKNLPQGVHFSNFTSTESIVLEKMTGDTAKGHYVFFIEFDTNDAVDSEGIAKKIDLTLADIYAQYKRFKDTDSIGPLRVIQVKVGTFDGLKAFIWNNTPHGQFKMPYVLRKEPALKYLLDQALQK